MQGKIPLHIVLRQYRVWATAIIAVAAALLWRMVDFMLITDKDFSTGYGTAFGGIAIALAGIVKFGLEAFTKEAGED